MSGTVPIAINSQEFVSDGFELPPFMVPSVWPLGANILVSNNNVQGVGSIYLDSMHRLHISGGVNAGDPFIVNSTSVGIPYGAALIYSIV